MVIGHGGGPVKGVHPRQEEHHRVLPEQRPRAERPGVGVWHDVHRSTRAAFRPDPQHGLPVGILDGRRWLP